MGYTITIGEFEVTPQPDDGLDASCITFGAKGVKLDTAPAFGDPTDYTNSRWPSYGVWPAALRQFDLESVFYDQGHLIGGHPGVRLVTKEMADKVLLNLARWRAEHPWAKPRHDVTDEESNLARVEWLEFWLRWALENCKVPVIANS